MLHHLGAALMGSLTVEFQQPKLLFHHVLDAVRAIPEEYLGRTDQPEERMLWPTVPH